MPKYIKVPCGFCEDCRRNQQNDWFFRAYQEYLSCMSVGGYVYFPTFTFDNEHLPVSEIEDDNGERLYVGAFDNADLRSFMRKMRMYLKRDGKPYEGIRYIFCSEFGGKKYRPHFHGLIFVPFAFSSDPNVNDAYALELFRHSWVNGFVGVGREGLRLKDIRGVRYAMKYVTKDMSFFDQKFAYTLTDDGWQKKEFDFKKWLNPSDDNLKKSRRKQMRNISPFHRQSLGLGMSFFDKINDLCKNDEDLVKFLVDDKYKLCDGEKGIFRIPKYYHRKIERVIDKELLSLMKKQKEFNTPVGAQVKVTKLYMSIKDMEKEFNSWNVPFIHTWLPENPVDVFGENCPKPSLLEDYKTDRHNLLCDLYQDLRKVDLYKFSVYYRLYRYLPASSDEMAVLSLEQIDDVISNYVTPHSQDIDYHILYGVPFDANTATPFRYDRNHVSDTTCSDLPYFSVYERLAQEIDLFKKYMCIQKQNNAYKNNLRKKELKQRFSKYSDYASYTSETK